jgi:hypothetical protein
MRVETQSFPAEDYLYWRDEILQVMYWMAGEGLGESVTPEDLVSFLRTDTDLIAEVMRRVAEERFLEPAGSGAYKLTELGMDAGKRGFALEFEGWQAQGHGDCDADCWCHKSAARAAQCTTERLAKMYGG